MPAVFSLVVRPVTRARRASHGLRIIAVGNNTLVSVYNLLITLTSQFHSPIYGLGVTLVKVVINSGLDDMIQGQRPFKLNHSLEVPSKGPYGRGPLECSRAQADIDTKTSLTAEINQGTQNRNPGEIAFVSLIAEDYRIHGSDVLSQGFWALFWQRFGNLRMSVRPRVLRMPLSLVYGFGAKISEWVGGIYLPYTVVVGRRVKLEHFGGMILVARAIGNDVIIRQNSTFGIANLDSLQDRPTIGDGVDIGTGAVILGNITVGRNARIGANAVLTTSVPAGVTVGGVPAKPLKTK